MAASNFNDHIQLRNRYGRRRVSLKRHPETEAFDDALPHLITEGRGSDVGLGSRSPFPPPFSAGLPWKPMGAGDEVDAAAVERMPPGLMSMMEKQPQILLPASLA